MTTHRPYRSWCKFCVMARGVNAPHRMLKTIWRECLMCQWTMGFLEKGNPRIACAGLRERRHKMTSAMLVPRNGTEFPWIAKRASKFIDQLGHNRVTLRCDNEPAIEALPREIAQVVKKGVRLCQRDRQWEKVSPTGSSSFVDGQARTLMAELEHRLGGQSPPDARILCWLVEFAAYLMNRCDSGSDGKTPLHGLHGRKDNTPILEFGEKMLYMPAKPASGESGSRGSTLECLWAC